MQTSLSKKYRQTQKGVEMEKILRRCVHCGFCNATCPTYQLLGDELDGPRGRIYLMKQYLEGERVTRETRLHLDRCLSCQACETTCPSGVEYHRLLDFTRQQFAQDRTIPKQAPLKKWLIRQIIPYPTRYRWLMAILRGTLPLLPAKLKQSLPVRPRSKHHRTKAIPTTEKKVILIQGCAQSAMTPETREAAKRLLQKMGIGIVEVNREGCCGALDHHLGENSRPFIEQNIHAWLPFLQDHAVEALISTASGCGLHLKHYPEILDRQDPLWEQASTLSEHVVDISEYLLPHVEKLQFTSKENGFPKIALHLPCTLQHGQKLGQTLKTLLTTMGFELLPVRDEHLCCGSAGSYSLLQPELSYALKKQKLEALTENRPDVIATANIGCLLHLRKDNNIPVMHWIELLDKFSEIS
ncbi:MAG: glycolate oxidase iron-sulfur subunit [Gammaproteobacteria bacterium]|nr:MAG: glycolate oxidase iron-sulfur subunit [Gammaproteobacteria bacterium]